MNVTIIAMSKIKVSIVCTNYNKGTWISDAIESFLKQKTNFIYEILVIDDKSTDESADYIKEYVSNYPDKIRAIYNKENLGITRTWIKICKEAKGEYIARCDGDDYWTDEYKLQKQVELLDKCIGSEWCSTDYDIVSPKGKLLQKSAFENGLVDRPITYAEMLATKGFIMSSTWLVKRKLMLEINEKLNKEAVDDTFNIQLDLFNRTKLSYIPESTVAYRINEGSDSRPIEMVKIKERNERLLNTQLEYIEKYKDVDYLDILKIILKRDMQIELWAIERMQIIKNQDKHIKNQDKHIHELVSLLKEIQDSRKYKYSVKLARIFLFFKWLPLKIVNKLYWLDGRRRYKNYYKKYKPTDEELNRQREIAKDFKYSPLISVVVPIYNTEPIHFTEMIDSVTRQTYTNWELVLVDDASPDTRIRDLIMQFANNDSRIKYKFLKNNKNIAGATNIGFDVAKGEYVSLLDHDDILHPSAIFEVVKALNVNRNLDFIYTDEDKINEKNQHVEPFIKPGWNQEFLYSVNYITHFATIKRSIIRKIGGERSQYNGAQDWDLFLRATNETKPDRIHHIPKILYSWRVHDNSTAKNLDAKPYVGEAQKQLLEDYFSEIGFNVDEFSISPNKLLNGSWNVEYKGQVREAMHFAGEPAEYGLIKGLMMTKDQVMKYFGKESLVANIYRNCNYTIEHK